MGDQLYKFGVQRRSLNLWYIFGLENTGVIYKCGTNQADLSGKCRQRSRTKVHSQTL